MYGLSRMYEIGKSVAHEIYRIFASCQTTNMRLNVYAQITPWVLALVKSTSTSRVMKCPSMVYVIIANTCRFAYCKKISLSHAQFFM